MRLTGLLLLVLLVAPREGLAAQRYDYCKMLNAKVVLFLVDRTDPYDDLDKEIISSAADRILRQIEPGDRLVIHTITDDFATSQKLFDECQPGCPEAGFFDELMGTCKEAIVRRDAVSFREEYARALLPLVRDPEEHNGSAIIETLSVLSRQYSDVGISRVIVFSDLVQNSRLGNFLKMSKAQFDQVRATIQKLGMTAHLNGASVIDFGFGRTQGENRKGLTPEINARMEAFWRAYFIDGGAVTATVNQRYE
jgi:hypothetical protein